MRQVLAEFGLGLPREVELRVEDSNQKCRFMVLPVRPPGTVNRPEEQLAEIVTRDTMIGVALPRADRKADDVRPVGKAGRSLSTMRRPASERRTRSATRCRGRAVGGPCPHPVTRGHPRPG